MPACQVLYSRVCDGARPVQVQEGKGVRSLYRVGADTHATKTSLLTALTGQQHWRFDRYFGLGRYTREPESNVLDLFGLPNLEVRPPSISLAPTLLTLTEDLTILARALNPVRTAMVIAPGLREGLGIDLANRGHEVKKLLFAGFGRRIHAAGYDPDDVLQYVYLGILTRNRGKCPWDPAKSSFGHYVHMVCGCLLANYHRKMRTRYSHEQVGLRGYREDGEWGSMDAAASNQEAGTSIEIELTGLIEVGTDLIQHLREGHHIPYRDVAIIEQAMPHMVQGLTRKETAARLGISSPALSRSLTLLRKHSSAWRERVYH